MASAGLDGRVIIWDAATLNQRITMMMVDENEENEDEEEVEQIIDSVTTLKWLPNTSGTSLWFSGWGIASMGC